MKIAYIVPGSGGSFYCGNCLRDSSFIKTISKTGHDTMIIPMYLPLSVYNESCQTDNPIFFGAVNIYLKQLSPLFKRIPKWLERYFDSMQVLKFAAKKAGSTRASGMAELTISMLKGEDGNQAAELNTLVNWFREGNKPDIIHLSNALLSGLAPKLKKELDVKVICTLQDEDEWIDEMTENEQKECWQLIEQNASYIDTFISVSDYFGNFILSKIPSIRNKLHTVHIGVDTDLYKPAILDKPNRAIGYMMKMTENFGLHLLIDAFIQIKQDKAFNDLKLKLSGGYTTDDKPFLKKIRKKIHKFQLENHIEFIDDFMDEARHKFFDEITVFSVPAIRKEAFGIQLLEAMASGVPVVVPNRGGYNEIAGITEAGIVYEPNSSDKLAESLKLILSDKTLYNKLQKNALYSAEKYFNSKFQAEKILDIYSGVKII